MGNPAHDANNSLFRDFGRLFKLEPDTMAGSGMSSMDVSKMTNDLSVAQRCGRWLQTTLGNKFREKRMRLFVSTLQVERSDKIIDIGGAIPTWRAMPGQFGSVDMVNRRPATLSVEDAQLGVQAVVGDATGLEAADNAYDVAYSNSVIEHVGTWENQQKFATEIQRVARRIWVQTPAKSFPIEPHYMTPFVHWLPRNMQKRVLRNFSFWGWVARPSPERVSEWVNEIRLLNYKEMKALFPDCVILKEKFFLIFTKSYIAYRT